MVISNLPGRFPDLARRENSLPVFPHPRRQWHVVEWISRLALLYNKVERSFTVAGTVPDSSPDSLLYPPQKEESITKAIAKIRILLI